MTDNDPVNQLEALLLSQAQTLSLGVLQAALACDQSDLAQWLQQLEQRYDGTALTLVRSASGLSVRVRSQYVDRIFRMRQKKPPVLSPSLLEVLALIVYQQPITRAEIEAVRGVSVRTDTMKALESRGWIRVVGHRETPGRPALWATTKQLLDDLNCQALTDLPALPELIALAEEPAQEDKPAAKTGQLLPADEQEELASE